MWALFPSAPAASEPGVDFYELDGLADWPDGTLNVLIVPPEHGPIYNSDTGALSGGNPKEVGINNTYIAAIEAAIGAWDVAVQQLGTDWLSDSYKPSVYVLGRDEVPTEILTKPDILVITDENEGPVLGTAYRLFPCVVRMSRMELFSFSYADMYNVTAQEYGHCLGLGHIGGQGGTDPTSDLKEPEHDVMNGFNTHPIGAKGTHLHCISNLDILALEQALGAHYTGYFWGVGPGGNVVMPAAAYGDTCVAPPANWREMTPPTADYGGYPVDSVIQSPSRGAVIPASHFKRIAGTGEAFEAERFDVEIGLARIDWDGSCHWWDQASQTFLDRDCYSPVWHTASGSTAWRISLGSFKAGHYRAVSRVLASHGSEAGSEACCWDAPNVADFELTKQRSRS
jgi:hypothetical protein